jgi:hypothetical protein
MVVEEEEEGYYSERRNRVDPPSGGSPTVSVIADQSQLPPPPPPPPLPCAEMFLFTKTKKRPAVELNTKELPKKKLLVLKRKFRNLVQKKHRKKIEDEDHSE